MTDLERARALFPGQHTEQFYEKLAGGFAGARRDSAEEFRAAAAAAIRAQVGLLGGEQYAAIVEALPLTPEEPT